MRKLVEFQILDFNAAHYGIDLFELMTNAGKVIATYIQHNYSQSEKIVFVCGSGNNGGDGYIASKILYEKGFEVTVVVAASPKTDIARKAFEQFGNDTVNISFLNDYISNTKLVVDCLLGSGIQGVPRTPFDKYIKQINKFENILAIDVPSGLGTETSVIPDSTLTFHDKKVGMNKVNCGKILVKDIGFPKDIDELTGPGELLLFPKFERNKHKGQNGKVAVIGGGQYSGAPALSALGAYRSGVDLVHVFVPESSYEQVSTFAPELIVHKLFGDTITTENIGTLFEDEFDSIVIGPGMGKDEASLEAVQLIIEKCDNLVIDADAISIHDFHGKNIILTPHKGELLRLGIQAQRNDLKLFAKMNNLTLLFKGEIDLITDGHFFKKNMTGHPRMAVGGSGDVLAGVCGAFMAKGLTSFESARLAAYSLGKAGEKCNEEIGAGFLPTDLALSLSKILLNNNEESYKYQIYEINRKNKVY